MIWQISLGRVAAAGGQSAAHAKAWAVSLTTGE